MIKMSLKCVESQKFTQVGSVPKVEGSSTNIVWSRSLLGNKCNLSLFQWATNVSNYIVTNSEGGGYGSCVLTNGFNPFDIPFRVTDVSYFQSESFHCQFHGYQDECV